MVSIAITGASGLVGGALVSVLADAPDVERIVGLDVRDPQRRAPGFEFRLADVAHAELKPLLEGVDVLVHLASIVDPIPDEALMARINVGGTRRTLDAAAAVGVRKVVHVSPTAVYGAWANNAVPLDEDAALRPNPGFAPAVQGAEIERLLAEWREDHPGVVVTTLRTAPVLGPGAERLPSRLLLGRPALRLRGAAPLVQATHVDDLVAALALVVLEDHPGTFNVASDAWLEPAEVRGLLPRSRVPELPPGLVERLLARSWSSGLGDVPPGVLPYLQHPWVVTNDRLKAIGWRPQRTNAEAVRAGVAAMGPPARRGPLVALLLSGVFGASGAEWLLRRRRGARRARRPTRR